MECVTNPRTHPPYFRARWGIVFYTDFFRYLDQNAFSRKVVVKETLFDGYV